MKLLPISISLCLILFSQPNFAIDTENFNSVYKAYTKAQKTGDIEKTLMLAEQALEIGRVRFAKDSENLNNLKHNLASAYIDNGQMDAAADIYEQLRKVAEHKEGKASRAYLVATIDLLNLYSEDKWPTNKLKLKDKKATKLASQVISIVKKLEKEEPSNATLVHYAATKALYKSPGLRKNYKATVKLTEKTRDMLIKDYGETDIRTVETRFRLGRLKMSRRQYKEAIEDLEIVIATVNNNLETSHPYELASHAVLVEAYEMQGKSEDATKHCVAIGQMKPWQDDVEPTPLYRQSPKYPNNYVLSGREGWARMAFDINTSGFVENIKVIDSDGKLFEKVSIAALDKWRYAPKFENGKAIVATNQEVQLDYKLQRN